MEDTRLFIRQFNFCLGDIQIVCIFDKGKFASGTLVASYEDIDMKGYIMGSVVMRLMPDNKTLFGKTVYFDHNQSQVVAHDYWLKR